MFLYFPKEIGLIIINYVTDEKTDNYYIVGLLKIFGLNKRNYLSKKYHDINDKSKYKMDKIIIRNKNELKMIKNKKINEIQFTGNFNEEVKTDDLPKGLIKIIFGRKFNQPVDNLPLELMHIVFNTFFNKKVDKLPSGLIKIEFGYKFNQNVEKIPKGTKEIIIQNEEQKELFKNLPEECKITIKNIKINY